MKKKLLITLLAVIAVVACVFGLSGCASTNGTYYKLGSDGKPDSKTYFVLKSGKWTDEDGESGTYKKNGDKIIFYYTFFGETEELCDGTLVNYVLKVNGDTFISEKHKHKYSEWKTTRPATCTVDGSAKRTCDCGVSETKTIEKLGHKLVNWAFDKTAHWKICTVCGDKLEEAEHIGEESCTVCKYHYGDTIGLSFELNSDASGYILTGIGSAEDIDIIIPTVYKDLPVTEIGYEAFRGCELLTSITIPDSVTVIGAVAFSGCELLASITIPNGVTSIGISAFRGCIALESITIPDSVTFIGSIAFSGTAYYNNKDNWENDVLYIGKHLIKAKTSLSSDYQIKKGTLTIGSEAFRGCNSLESITIPDSVTAIGEYAFYKCTALTIYCEAEEKPNGWDSKWNYYCPVVWGYKGEN